MRAFIASFFLFLLSWHSFVVADTDDAIDLFREAHRLRPRVPPVYSVEPTIKSRAQKRQSRFLNGNSQQFVVDGTAIPDVNFDVGESYAGLLPISQDSSETRKLYFWFFPSTNASVGNEITLWFNGGPGCSSLNGLLQENGPFLWQAGTYAPTPNPYSWTNLTNVVWIEQPVGVGFTQGTPNITNEIQLAQQFVGFWRNFIDTFQMQNFKTYITGESYAGYYVPYVADAFLSQQNSTYYNLAGIIINDPLIGDRTVQQNLFALPVAQYWDKIFNLNASISTRLQQRQDQCNYTSYINKYLTFPPPAGPFPTPNNSCNQFINVALAASYLNPCFNIYHLTDTCPIVYSQLGGVNVGDYVPAGAQPWFNRTDVKRAINAPVDTNWVLCARKSVFVSGDRSPGPGRDGTLQRVIERTNNVMIGSGNLDFILPSNGTLLVIQNVTWNGLKGFQTYPQRNQLYVPYHPEFNGGSLAEAGLVGAWGTERGLTYYTVQLAGHELPGYAPGAAYRVMEVFLGRVANLSVVSSFTTQNDNFTGNGRIYRRDFDEYQGLL